MVGLDVLLFFVLDAILPQGEWEQKAEIKGGKMEKINNVAINRCKLITSSIILLFLLFTIAGCSGYTEEVPLNEQPMYGNIPPDLELQKIHDKYIKTVITDHGSREAAILGGLETAWYFYSKNDFKTAIKRFNQVWLLDPNNAEVFYGFGLLMDRQSKTDDAITFYRKSLELDPNNEKAMCCLASISCKKALKNKAYDEFEKSLLLYQKAIDITKETGHTDFIGRIYAEWAIGLYYKEDDAEAWKKVKLARQNGAKVNPDFIKELSRSMPEPK